MAMVVNDPPPGHVFSSPDMEEEEEELFEINLEAADEMPPTNYFWDGCHYLSSVVVGAGKTNTLFANCLMPIEDVSSAVPAMSSGEARGPVISGGRRWSFSGVSYHAAMVGGELFTLGKLLELPLPGQVSS